MHVSETCPVLRIFDEALALHFYTGLIGFTLDWDHRFGENFPLYARVSRGGLILHLSGHFGDASPGACIFVRLTGLDAFHAERAAQNDPNLRPGFETLPWGRQMTLTDPFANCLAFCECLEIWLTKKTETCYINGFGRIRRVTRKVRSHRKTGPAAAG